MDHRFGWGESLVYEYIVLGAGPAGLQMGHHLSRAGHTSLILEAGDSPGHSFKQYPRHRTLLSVNKVYTGSEDPELSLRHDWNSILSDQDGAPLFKEYSHRYFPSADEMVRYLSDYADCHGLEVRCNTRVIRVEKAGVFRLFDTEGNVFSCKRLIVATGASKPWVPQIPGAELAESYADVSVDPEDFINQRVLILGKGNSAFETANNLVATAACIHLASPNPVRLAWATRHAGHLRAVNSTFLDTCRLGSQNAVLDCTVERIERRDGEFVVAVRSSHARGETGELRYDRVIFCTGFRFDASIFAGECRPELVIDGRFPAQTGEWESVNVPGLYFAGALSQANDDSGANSGFIQGFRYNVRALFRMLEKKHHHKAWEASREVEPTPEGLVEAVLSRINRSSALWHQHGFLHDVLVVSDDWDRATCHEEMPLAYVHAGGLGESSHYYTLSLELGGMKGEPGKAEEGGFLHPVIRRWCGRQLVSEKHLPEDLFGEWKKEDAHVAPLRYFFVQQVLETADLLTQMRYGGVELELQGGFAQVAM